jgi:hypothetical protein
MARLKGMAFAEDSAEVWILLLPDMNETRIDPSSFKADPGLSWNFN